MSMGYGRNPQYLQQQQAQMADLRQRLSGLMLPLGNPAAFQPSAVQTLLQPGAAQPNWLQYGTGPEQQFFQPYYMNMGSQIGQYQDINKQIADLQKQMTRQPMGLLNSFAIQERGK